MAGTTSDERARDPATPGGAAAAAARDRAAAQPLTGRLVEAARAAWAADPWFWGAFVVLWLATLLPIWTPRFLPLLDLPAHLDAINVWHRFHRPDWHLAEYYKLNLIPFPYFGYYFPAHLLAYLMPVEAASKLYISAYTLLLPLALRTTALQFGRSPRLALFAFPLVFNMSFTYGFITFCAGLVPLLYGIVLLDRFLQAPTRRRAVGLCLLTIGLYLCHVLPWFYFGLASLVLALSHGRPLRALAAGALELPSVALALWGARVASMSGTVVQTSRSGYRAQTETVLAALESLPSRILSEWPSNWAGLAVIAFGVLWLGLLVTARDERPPEGHPGFRYRFELQWLLSLACYFLLPVHLYRPVDLWMISPRFITLTALLGALLPLGPVAGRRRGWLLALTLFGVAYPVGLTRAWLRYDNDQAAAFRRVIPRVGGGAHAPALRRVIARVERGANTLTLVGDGADKHASPAAVPFLNYHAYTHLFVGGFDPYRLSSGFPYIERPGHTLPAPRFRHPNDLVFAEQVPAWDYILTKDEPDDYSLFGPDDAGQAPLVAHDGGWRLYKVRH